MDFKKEMKAWDYQNVRFIYGIRLLQIVLVSELIVNKGDQFIKF